ncbi:unnamed protein product, partial [Musa acuminata subsp. burmannicoides]
FALDPSQTTARVGPVPQVSSSLSSVNGATRRGDRALPWLCIPRSSVTFFLNHSSIFCIRCKERLVRRHRSAVGVPHLVAAFTCGRNHETCGTGPTRRRLGWITGEGWTARKMPRGVDVTVFFFEGEGNQRRRGIKPILVQRIEE